MILYYNCDDPTAIIKAGIIRSNKIFTGVSLSDWSELGSHGPFKIQFDATEFNMHRVMYWVITSQRQLRYKGMDETTLPTYYARNQDGEEVDKAEYDKRFLELERMHNLEFAVGNKYWLNRIWKTSNMFQDEREYYSPNPIQFNPINVQSVSFMTNAPCAVGPRILKRRIAELKEMLGDRYIERRVEDPRLKK